MIVAEQVTKYYGTHAAVRDLDFRINEGECVGFLGLNGAGKTTTLRLLSCLLLPTSGRITVRGLDAEKAPHEIRKFIGFLPDTPPLYDEMSVAQYLRFAGKLRQMSSQEISKRLPQVLETCDLGDVAHQDLSTLSHGYRQRVGIGQAIIHNPSLLILDEPIQGLDPVQIVEMRKMIRNLRGKHTILLSTHILSEIKQTCDRILMLSEGAIAAEGTEGDLIERFGGDTVLEFELRGDEAKLPTVLATVSGADQHEVMQAANGTLQVKVRAQKDLREALSAAFVGGGFGLLGLQRKSSGLERIFVNLSQSRDSAAGGAAHASQSLGAASASPKDLGVDAGPADDPAPADKTESSEGPEATQVDSKAPKMD